MSQHQLLLVSSDPCKTEEVASRATRYNLDEYIRFYQVQLRLNDQQLKELLKKGRVCLDENRFYTILDVHYEKKKRK